MPYVEAPGRRLYAESFGTEGDPGLLLIRGLGAQLTAWPVALCEAFVDRGFHVVRYDNRDCGLSTIYPEGATYTLSDMADDAVHVIEHFDLEPAHVLGISMGGMIAQVLAAERDDVVASLTTFASTTGNPTVGMPSDHAWEALVAPPPTSREEAMVAGVRDKKLWGTADTWNEDDVARDAGDDWERSHPQGGVMRQLTAIAAAGNRDEQVRTIRVPTLVVHGDADALIDVSGGRHTAELIEGSTYLEIEGMNHDMPITEWPRIVQAVTAHASAAGGG